MTTRYFNQPNMSHMQPWGPEVASSAQANLWQWQMGESARHYNERVDSQMTLDASVLVQASPEDMYPASHYSGQYKRADPPPLAEERPCKKPNTMQETIKRVEDLRNTYMQGISNAREILSEMHAHAAAYPMVGIISLRLDEIAVWTRDLAASFDNEAEPSPPETHTLIEGANPTSLTSLQPGPFCLAAPTASIAVWPPNLSEEEEMVAGIIEEITNQGSPHLVYAKKDPHIKDQILPFDKVAKNLLQRFESDTAIKDSFAQKDKVLLSRIFLVDLFGIPGINNARDFILALQTQDTPTFQAYYAPCHKSQLVCEKLKAAGLDDLAEFVSNWAFVTQYDQYGVKIKSPTDRFSLMFKRYKSVQYWESIDHLDHPQKWKLGEFLCREVNTLQQEKAHRDPKYNPQVSKASQISALVCTYLCSVLDLPYATTPLYSRLYRLKPISVLVKTFGHGIIPHIPVTILGKYWGLFEGQHKKKRTTPKGGYDDRMTRIDKFTLAVKVLWEENRGFGQYCQRWEEEFVNPYVKGEYVSREAISEALLDIERARDKPSVRWG